MPDTLVYKCCPKCRHAPLPADQSLPAACPACGLILAKFAAPLSRVSYPLPDGMVDAEPGRWQKLTRGLGDAVRHVPPRVDPAAFWGRAALLALFAIWGCRLIWMDYRSGEIGSSFLHGPLLVFHEAGHDWMYLLGETGLLKRAHGLGWLVHKLGALTVLLSLAWAGWILRRQKDRLDHPLINPTD